MIQTNQLLKLQGKVAIITGSATGLGATAAQMLAEAGANVLINYMPGQEAQAQAVSDMCNSDSFCYPCDITNDEACKNLVQAVLDRWGHVDILVNNAGFNKLVDHDDLEGLSGQDFIDLYNVHVVGSYQMIRAVAPAMKSHGKGVVVNVSSVSGESGYGSSVAYSASKGAVNTLTKSLGRALAPNIRVNAICPGVVITPLWDKLQYTEAQQKQWLEAVVSEIPLKIEPTPEIVARNILYLCCDLSAHLTGQLITVDGGSSLGLYHKLYENHDEF